LECFLPLSRSPAPALPLPLHPFLTLGETSIKMKSVGLS
jgi:hypothetical protein